MIQCTMLNGARLSVDPVQVGAVQEASQGEGENIKHFCVLFMFNMGFPITFTYDQWIAAVEEYMEEMALEAMDTDGHTRQ